jgi:hypothetical protein
VLLELQFHLPRTAPIVTTSSCDNTDSCAAMIIAPWPARRAGLRRVLCGCLRAIML